jgi:hypothetical protein
MTVNEISCIRCGAKCWLDGKRGFMDKIELVKRGWKPVKLKRYMCPSCLSSRKMRAKAVEKALG